MNADIILQILQWAIPGGIAGAATWLVSRKARTARTAKEVHDTYKEMYHDISSEIIQLRKDNAEILQNSEKVAQESRELKRAIQRLSNAIQDIQNAVELCPYHSCCPVRGQLQDAPGRRDERGEGLYRGRKPRKDGTGGDRAAMRDGHRDPPPRQRHGLGAAGGGGMDNKQRERIGHGAEDAERDDDHRDGAEDAAGGGPGESPG